MTTKFSVIAKSYIIVGAGKGISTSAWKCIRVRSALLEYIVDLIDHGVFEDSSLVDGCYHRAVQLLGDMEDCVRSSAICVVASWRLILAASNADMKSYWSNEVFAKLCSMARDMRMEVRVEALLPLERLK
ncbi:hypothetical protein K1719_028237 [Acacia pycnantha]|nr:hypothetical protein K1719_028237 [Acacia pycnantha]